MNIHNRLKMLREEKGSLQKEVASYIGVSERVYGFYEKDRFPKDEKVLNKLAEYFDVTIDYLLGKTDSKEIIVVNKNVDGYEAVIHMA